MAGTTTDGGRVVVEGAIVVSKTFIKTCENTVLKILIPQDTTVLQSLGRIMEHEQQR